MRSVRNNGSRGKIYQDGTTSKTQIRSDADCASRVRKQKVVESASPANPEMGGSIKRKKNNLDHPSDQPTGGKTCLLHVPGNSTEE